MHGRKGENFCQTPVANRKTMRAPIIKRPSGLERSEKQEEKRREKSEKSLPQRVAFPTPLARRLPKWQRSPHFARRGHQRVWRPGRRLEQRPFHTCLRANAVLGERACARRIGGRTAMHAQASGGSGEFK